MTTTYANPVIVTDSTGAILAKIEEKKRIAKADYAKYLHLKMPVMKQDLASRCSTCVALFEILETNRARETNLLDVLQHAAIDSGELSTKVKARETTCASLNEKIQCLLTERNDAIESAKDLTNRMHEQLRLHEARESEQNTKNNLMTACNMWLFKKFSAGFDLNALKEAIRTESDQVLQMALTEMCNAASEGKPEGERVVN